MTSMIDRITKAKKDLQKRLEKALNGDKTDTEKVKRALTSATNTAYVVVQTATSIAGAPTDDGGGGRSRSNAVSEGSTPVDTEVSEALDFLGLQVETCALKADQAREVGTEIRKLLSFEFIKLSPNALRNLTTYSTKLAWYASRMDARKQSAIEISQSLKAARALGDQKERAKQLAKFNEEVKKFKKSAEDAAREVADTVSGMEARVEEQALYNYFKSHPDEAREILKTTKMITGAVTGSAAKFVPPGYKWAAATYKLLEEVAFRSVDEGLVARQEGDYRKAHLSPAEIFDKFTEDPTIMAAGLAETIKDNIRIVFGVIDIALADTVIWGEIKPVVVGVVNGVVDGRVDKAKDVWAQQRNAEALKEAYRSSVTGVEEQLTEDLKDALADTAPEVVEIGKLLVEHAEDSEFTNVDISAGVGLASFLVPFVVRRVVRAIPIEPAQLVSGEDLQAALNGIAKAQIPAKWFRTSEPTKAKPGEVRAKVSDDELPADTPNGAAILDSELRECKRDAAGNIVAWYVAFSCSGMKVWGYLNERGAWLADKVDRGEMNPSLWAERRITLDGYTVTVGPGRVAKVTGKWYRPWRTRGDYIFQHDNGTLEFVIAETSTVAGGGTKNTVGGLLGDRAIAGFTFTPGT
jgi:hypothetical protein